MAFTLICVKDGTSGSRIKGSSFSGLLTRVDNSYLRIGSAGKGRIKSWVGFVVQPAHAIDGCEDERQSVVDFGNRLIGVSCDIAQVSYHESVRCSSLIWVNASNNGRSKLSFRLAALRAFED